MPCKIHNICLSEIYCMLALLILPLVVRKRLFIGATNKGKCYSCIIFVQGQLAPVKATGYRLELHHALTPSLLFALCFPEF